jgi:hypothetical protein
MTTLGTVALYYDAWQNRRGDFSNVPLADDFEFTGPVASFDSADGYRAMAREAGHAVTSSRCSSSTLSVACLQTDNDPRVRDGYISLDTRGHARALKTRREGLICRKNVAAGARSCPPVPLLNLHGKEGVAGSTRSGRPRDARRACGRPKPDCAAEASPGPHEGAVWHLSTAVGVMEPCGFALLPEVGSINRAERAKKDEGDCDRVRQHRDFTRTASRALAPSSYPTLGASAFSRRGTRDQAAGTPTPPSPAGVPARPALGDDVVADDRLLRTARLLHQRHAPVGER